MKMPRPCFRTTWLGPNLIGGSNMENVQKDLPFVNQQPSQVCSGCGVTKPIEKFEKYTSTNGVVRRYRECNSCKHKKRKVREVTGTGPRKRELTTQTGFRVCTQCKLELPLDSFNKLGTRYRTHLCKKCDCNKRRPQRKRRMRQRASETLAELQSKDTVQCARCGLFKPPSHYSVVTSQYGNERLDSVCTTCRKGLPADYRVCIICGYDKPIEDFRSTKLSWLFRKSCSECYSNGVSAKRGVKHYGMETGPKRRDGQKRYKRCTWCKQMLPREKFYVRKKTGHLVERCIDCLSRHKDEFAPDSVVAKRKQRVKEKAYANWRNGKTRDRLYRKKYGITEEQYQALLASQNGVCAICGREDDGLTSRGNRRRLSVDHSHQTNAVRGILCGRCNTGIGWFSDNPDRMKKAQEYLHKYQDSETQS